MEFRSSSLYADFYENPGRPLVVLIGGSRKGLPAISPIFLDYLKKKSNVLVLAYFGVDGLPRNLDKAPLEYFVNAVNETKAKTKVKDRDVTLIGSSKGGEAVLLLISHYLTPSRAVACVPSCYAWQAIPHGISSLLFPRSSWTYQGKEIPYMKFRYSRKIVGDIRNKVYLSCHEKAIAGRKDDRAFIDLREYGGELLLLSAEKDNFWPSKKMSEALLENGPGNVTHKVLDLEGHYFLEYEDSVREIVSFLETPPADAHASRQTGLQ